MPALRIALVTSSTRPCGATTATLALAEALTRAGQDVTVWALTCGPDTGFHRPIDPAVRVLAVPFPDVEGADVAAREQRAIGVLAAAFTAAARLGGEYDIVHAQDDLAGRAGPGWIRTVRHLDEVRAGGAATARERALREPSALVCVGAALAAELELGWGIRAAVIPDGVEAARFEAAAGADPEAVEQRRYWTDRFGDFVLTVGGIEPRKGTADLVRAMARVRRRRPGTRLVIAGGGTGFDDGEYRRQVTALAVRLRIEPEVLGPLEHARLPGLVAAAGAFAFGSVQAGSGLAALEALAAGVPVLTRDLPAFREVFGDVVRFAAAGDGTSGDIAAGLAVQIVAALEGSTDESARATRIAGQALAARRNWDDVASAHLGLYSELIKVGRPVGSTG